jgi:hypothetical protein
MLDPDSHEELRPQKQENKRHKALQSSIINIHHFIPRMNKYKKNMSIYKKKSKFILYKTPQPGNTACRSPRILTVKRRLGSGISFLQSHCMSVYAVNERSRKIRRESERGRKHKEEKKTSMTRRRGTLWIEIPE